MFSKDRHRAKSIFNKKSIYQSAKETTIEVNGK
jgi:hypothetical protein